MAQIEIGGNTIEVDNSVLTEAVEKGTAKIDTDLVIYKPDDFESYKTTLSNDEYKKGKTAGEEMTVKILKQKAGIEVEGKDPEAFINTFKSSILEQAQIEPSKEIEQLKKDKESLQKNYSELESNFNTFKTDIQQKETRTKKDNQILSFLPDEGLKVNKKQALNLMRLEGYDIDYTEDGLTIPKKGDEVQKDPKTLQPIKPDDFFKTGLKELGLIEDKPGGTGRGGDDSTPPSAGSYESFVKEMADTDTPEGSIGFNQEMQKRIKSGTLKI